MSISGDVKCKGTCSSMVKVMLAPVGSLGIDTAAKRETSLTSDGFKFDKILPGTYRLEVHLSFVFIFGSCFLFSSRCIKVSVLGWA